MLLYGITQGNGFKTVTPKEEAIQLRVRRQQGPERRTAAASSTTGLNNLKASGEYDEDRSSAYLGEGATTDDNSFFGLVKSTFPILLQGLKMTDHPDGRLDRRSRWCSA